MPKWKITYTNNDGNTSVVEYNHAEKPDMEKAAQLVRDDALSDTDYDDSDLPNDYDAPTIALLERHGITISGIAQVD
ncbi:hypothetical protein IQ22_02855 [Pseudomonas duriflava]|uniref:Uncharacterized protein n=1 Tax=Pseudomonas duriflava TaxID=459528 RepID=A0A562Q8H7_9PSED|nr:hypothetical protein [Pseudomonas duriflava]TWI53018.1 hypothetical protein IQ22_02855 [Pseudomonas duriflava]